jgi:light-independent protochlorophyllide reductase subunit B
MEDHLLEIFGGHDTKAAITQTISSDSDLTWSKDGLAELSKVPGFVRNKVKRNTEKFARDRQIQAITAETLYAAKEALSS